MPSPGGNSPPRRRSVFINCPFDAEHKPLFRANAAFQAIVPDIIADLRLDEFDALPHSDYMHVVETALPQIEAARSA